VNVPPIEPDLVSGFEIRGCNGMLVIALLVALLGFPQILFQLGTDFFDLLGKVLCMEVGRFFHDGEGALRVCSMHGKER
jgi:hypothetical protein